MSTSTTEMSSKDRYKSGVLAYKKMGYWEPDYRVKDAAIRC
jgi:ribulose-bisphosphate carboxylase large chain